MDIIEKSLLDAKIELISGGNPKIAEDCYSRFQEEGFVEADKKIGSLLGQIFK